MTGKPYASRDIFIILSCYQKPVDRVSKNWACKSYSLHLERISHVANKPLLKYYVIIFKSTFTLRGKRVYRLGDPCYIVSFHTPELKTQYVYQR